MVELFDHVSFRPLSGKQLADISVMRFPVLSGAVKPLRPVMSSQSTGLKFGPKDAPRIQTPRCSNLNNPCLAQRILNV